jgi:sugar/nucleoside kinase (ribokinase family)
MGSKGSYFYNGEMEIITPSVVVEKEKILDTCGSGDCFMGSFSHFLAENVSIKESIQYSTYICSLKIQKRVKF